MKKSNITHLTSCNVQPNLTPHGDSMDLFDNVHAFYLPNLTEDQRNKIPADELTEGCIVLDVTDPDNHHVLVYCTKYPDLGAAWHIVQVSHWIDPLISHSKSSAITHLTGLKVQPDINNTNINIFYMPALTPLQIYNIPDDELRYGAMVYNTAQIVFYKKGGGEAAWFYSEAV